MCLMHTDFPVPDGPRIIEIFPSGMPMFRPRRILLRPKALWTSMNSIASGTPVGRFSPVCHWYSSSSPAGAPLADRDAAALGRLAARLLVAAQVLGVAARRGPASASVRRRPVVRRRLVRERLVVGGAARAVLVRVLHVSLRWVLVGWRPRTAACRASR